MLIQPAYFSETVNFPIKLADVQVELVSGKTSVRADGSAVLRLVPDTGVIVTVRVLASTTGLTVEDTPTLRIGSSAWTTPARVVRESYSSKKSFIEIDLLPQGPLILCDSRELRLREAKFHILNFPEFFCTVVGSSDFMHQTDGRGIRLGRVMLHNDQWQLEIQALPSTSQLIKQLKAEGGSAITHVGRLARLDQEFFTVPAAERVLNDLHHFLSFARGAYTAIFGVVGVDADGATVYENWSMRQSAPWMSAFRWFDIHHGQSLADEYPGFVALLRDRDLGKAVTAALHWYLRSNLAGAGPGIDGGLILSQAALERLAHAILKKSATIRSPKTAAAVIRMMIEQLNLPVAIPVGLSRAAEANLGIDGPDLIVKVRNELVHPKNRLGVPLKSVVTDAWRLAQWYIELVILRLSEYDGVYSNRLKPGWIGEVESVPWVADRDGDYRLGSG